MIKRLEHFLGYLMEVRAAVGIFSQSTADLPEEIDDIRKILLKFNKEFPEYRSAVTSSITSLAGVAQVFIQIIDKFENVGLDTVRDQAKLKKLIDDVRDLTMEQNFKFTVNLPEVGKFQTSKSVPDMLREVHSISTQDHISVLLTSINKTISELQSLLDENARKLQTLQRNLKPGAKDILVVYTPKQKAAIKKILPAIMTMRTKLANANSDQVNFQNGAEVAISNYLDQLKKITTDTQKFKNVVDTIDKYYKKVPGHGLDKDIQHLRNLDKVIDMIKSKLPSVNGFDEELKLPIKVAAYKLADILLKNRPKS